MTVNLLAASDPAEAVRWDQLVARSPSPDSYFQAGYARAYEVEGHGRAAALHVETTASAWLLPVLLRPLSDLSFAPDTSSRDAITPYGYGGLLPLSSVAPSPEEVAALATAVREWAAEHGLVSVVLRLHPLLAQQSWLSSAADGVPGLSVRTLAPTAGIEVQQFTESGMKRIRRSNLKAARSALRLTWSSPAGGDGPALPDALAIFERIYQVTMERLGATSFYLFSPGYYRALAEGLGEGFAVELAWHGDEPVGAMMFLAGPDFAHYHLGGATDLGRTHKAQTLLICGGVEWARARGCRILHLGGGVSPGDSLFEFKESFGGPTYQYAMASLVTDQRRYDALVAARRAAGGAPPRENYFPEYRA